MAAVTKMSTVKFIFSKTSCAQRFMNSQVNCTFRKRGFVRLYSEDNTRPPQPSQMGLQQRPSTFDKIILVFTGKFASVKEVPNTVSRETMQKSKDKARIYISIVMAVLTIFGCVAMIISGKSAARRGESVAKMTEDWHREINAQK